MKKRKVLDGQGTEERAQACRLTESLPSLAEFLSETVWEDGTARQTGTLMVFVEEGRWKGWLHDRDQGCSAFLSNTTLSNLLACLDTALAGDEVEWRPDRPRPSGGSRKGQ